MEQVSLYDCDNDDFELLMLKLRSLLKVNSENLKQVYKFLEQERDKRSTEMRGILYSVVPDAEKYDQQNELSIRFGEMVYGNDDLTEICDRYLELMDQEEMLQAIMSLFFKLIKTGR